MKLKREWLVHEHVSIGPRVFLDVRGVARFFAKGGRWDVGGEGQGEGGTRRGRGGSGAYLYSERKTGSSIDFNDSVT